jgi:hypothetical protein
MQQYQNATQHLPIKKTSHPISHHPFLRHYHTVFLPKDSNSRNPEITVPLQCQSLNQQLSPNDYIVSISIKKLACNLTIQCTVIDNVLGIGSKIRARRLDEIIALQ